MNHVILIVPVIGVIFCLLLVFHLHVCIIDLVNDIRSTFHPIKIGIRAVILLLIAAAVAALCVLAAYLAALVIHHLLYL